jgi:hypothetical protein
MKYNGAVSNSSCAVVCFSEVNMTKKRGSEYYCVCVRRNYESIWRVVSKHDTREQAQAALEEKRAYTGVFNYDNAELRVLSRTEAKAEFGPHWEYKPIGEAKAKETASKSKAE